jgi:hypothetical protein
MLVFVVDVDFFEKVAFLNQPPKPTYTIPFDESSDEEGAQEATAERKYEKSQKES